MKKALGYARVSGKSQEIDGTGLDEQVAQISAWAALNGYEIVDWFRDAVTGEVAWTERPAMKALVERLAMNGVEAIIVHQMDRVARGKSGVFESFYEVAEAAGVAVWSVVDGLLTEDATADEFKSADAEMIRSIKQAIVRQEKRKLVARMALGKLREKAKGNRTDGKFAFGNHPDKPEEKTTLARMQQLSATGLTCYRIAKILDAENLRPRHAEKWSVIAVQQILKRSASLTNQQLSGNRDRRTRGESPRNGA
jgi:DNA invertase Pin-like site-specific DNA recombinase